MQEQLPKRICPYLRSIVDQKIVVGYPTRENRCHVCPNPKPVTYQHQELLCLDSRHQECPVYNRPQLAQRMRLIGKETSVLTTNLEPGIYDREVKIHIGRDNFIKGLAVVVVVIALVGAFRLPAVRAFLWGDDPVVAPPIILTPEGIGVEAAHAAVNQPSATAHSTEVSMLALASPISVITGEVPTDAPTNEPATHIAATEVALAADLPPTQTPTITNTATETPAPSETATNTATPTETPTVLPSETSTPPPTNTVVPTNTPAPTDTPQPEATTAASLEIKVLMARVTEEYGLQLEPAAWLPADPAAQAATLNHLAAVLSILETLSGNLHLYSNASAEQTPQEFFRHHFGRLNVQLVFEDARMGLYGAETRIVEENGQTTGYVIRLAPAGLSSAFPLGREIALIINHSLDGVPEQHYAATMGGYWQSDTWVPGMGYYGYELLFPSAVRGPLEDFQDVFGRMLSGELSDSTAPERYQFMLQNLPLWLFTVQASIGAN